MGTCHQGEIVQTPATPVTPVTSEALASLQNVIKQDAHTLDETSKQRLQRHLQKFANAAQISFAQRTLQQDQIRFLVKMNKEAKVRRSTKSVVLGKAKVMSYEDFEEARAKRAAKDAAKDAAKEAAKAVKEAAKEDATAGKGKRGRKRKSPADAPEPNAPVAQMTEAQVAETDAPEPKAPVARMSEAQVAEGEIFQFGSVS